MLDEPPQPWNVCTDSALGRDILGPPGNRLIRNLRKGTNEMMINSQITIFRSSVSIKGDDLVHADNHYTIYDMSLVVGTWL